MEQQQQSDKMSYTCTDGTVVKLRVASHTMFVQIESAVEQQFRRDGRQVDPPQYTAELAGGGEETHDHDEKSIEDASPQEKEQWQDYLDTLAEIEIEAKRRVGLFIWRKGLDGIDEAEVQSGDWITEYEKWAGPPPDDPDERFIMYVETQIVKTPSDQVEVMGRILTLMFDGVPEELAAAMRDTFRGALAGYAASAGLQPAMGQVARQLDDSETAGDD